MIVSFPTEDDFKRLGITFPSGNLTLNLEDITQHSSNNNNSSFIRAIMSGDMITWVNSYNTRIYHARRSYIFMNYYFEQGIPEDIDPSKLDSITYNIKDYFDYFADHFFYKLFSAWDTIGHILNFMFNLNIKKPSFEGALEQLKKKYSTIYSFYEPITTDTSYITAKQVRNNITHNVPYGIIDNRAIEISNRTYFGVSKYTPPKDIFNTAKSTTPLLEQTILVLKTKPHS